MNENQIGTITTIAAHGERARRIRDMGLVPGARITLKGCVPLKDPVALRVMGCTPTLRNNDTFTWSPAITFMSEVPSVLAVYLRGCCGIVVRARPSTGTWTIPEISSPQSWPGTATI